MLIALGAEQRPQVQASAEHVFETTVAAILGRDKVQKAKLWNRKELGDDVGKCADQRR